jgi:tRNA pseudouridine55 synthase
MHSALKKDGKALYEYARAGEEVEREARGIVVHRLELAFVEGSRDSLFLRAKVSKGTYIRTLGEDIGEALGCGGHLTALRRTGTGHFDVTQCVTLEALEALDEAQRTAALLPLDALLVDHARVTLDGENAGRFLSGLRRRGDWEDNEHVAVFGAPPSQPSPEGGRGKTKDPLLGTGHIKGGELIPGRLLSPPEVEQILESNP